MLDSVFHKVAVLSFPVNIAKILRTAFFIKKPPVAVSEIFINFPGKHQWRRRNGFTNDGRVSKHKM